MLTHVKKVLCGMLALSMLGLAGCGMQKQTKEAGAGTEVPVVKWLIAGDSQPDLEAVVEKINEYIEPKIGANLDLQIIDGGSYQEKLQMLMASGGDFDLCFVGFNNPYLSGAQKGGFLELDKYLENSPLKEDEDLKLILDNVKYNGHIYGIPNVQILTGCTGLVFNKKLADEYGLDYDSINCLEDCEPYLEWVKNTHPEIYPFRTGQYGGGWSFSETADAIQGMRVESDTGSPVVLLDKEDEAKRLEAEKLHDWYKKGYIRKDVASVTDDSSEYNAGKYALSRAAYKPGGDTENNMLYPDNQVVIKKVGTAFLSHDAGTGCMTAINKRSAHPDEAFKLMELVNTDPVLINMLSYGIEGKHYTLIDGKVRKMENSGYSLPSWQFGNVFNAYLLENQADDTVQQTRELHNSARQSAIKGFAFDSDNVRTEIAQLETIRKKYKNIKTGAEDPADYYDTYLRELEQAGEGTLKAEIEKQLKAWQDARQ